MKWTNQSIIQSINICPTESKPVEEDRPPQFIKVPDNVTVREKDNAEFVVRVDGSPRPTGKLNAGFVCYLLILNDVISKLEHNIFIAIM